MSRIIIGTTPVQVARYNPKRRMLLAEFLPSSIIAGNVGLIFGKFGSAPTASTGSPTWDFLLNAGSSNGSNSDESLLEAPDKRDLWLVSDTAAQEVNVVEHNMQEPVTPSAI